MTEAQDTAIPPAPEGAPSIGGRARSWDLILFAIVLMIACQIAVRPLGTNHDVGLNLDCGRMLLEGKRPYLDFIDTNPPMIMYVSALPALVAKFLPVHVILAFHLLVFCVMLLSALTTRRFLARSGLGLGEQEQNGAALSIFLLSLALVATREMDWGQREHLFLLLYLPFFFCRWIRWQGGEAGPVVAALAGIAAAIGACFKPYFVVAALLVELAQVLAGRRVRPLLQPEWITFVLTGAAYAAHFILLPGESLTAYFQRWAPLVLEGYGAYNQPWSVLLVRPGTVMAVGGSLLGMVISGRIAGPRATLARLLSLFSLVSYALYLSHHKGWSYQLIPAGYAGILAAMTAWAARAHSRDGAASPLHWPSPRIAVWVLAGSILSSGTQLAAEWQKGFQPWPDPGMGEILDRHSKAGDPVLFLTTDVAAVYPLLLQTRRIPASRYIWTFPLALIYARDAEASPGDEPYPYHSRGSMPPEETRLLDELGADIAVSRPPMILINAVENPQGCPSGFSLPGYFKSTGFLEAEMAGYRFVETAFFYDIYVRTSADDNG